MVGRWVSAAVLGVCLGLSPAVGNAAEFNLIDDLSTINTTPSDPTAPCSRAADAFSEVTDLGGVAATFEADMGAEAAGDVATCNETAQADSTARGVWELVPTMMEDPGDPVTVCILIELDRTAGVEDDATAEIEQDLILLKAKSATSSRVLIRIRPDTLPGPFKVIEGKRIDEFTCGREVTMAVGERLEGSIGGTATAKVSGVGSSEAQAEFEMAAIARACSEEFTPCPDNVSAPAISPLPLGALAGLMVLAGMGVARLRRMQ